MPSHTAASAMVKLYSCNGAPWAWPVWQELTNVHHTLFPENDADLPPGWTRQNAIDVQSYFRAYISQPSEEKKIVFAYNEKNSRYPGREFWNAFIARRWNSWGIHTLIVDELREYDIHPLEILIRQNDLTAPWPSADTYVPIILDTLGMRLFGEEAFQPGVSVLAPDLRKCVMMLAQRSWNTLRLQVQSMKARPSEIEAAALAAFAGEYLYYYLVSFLNTS